MICLGCGTNCEGERVRREGGGDGSRWSKIGDKREAGAGWSSIRACAIFFVSRDSLLQSKDACECLMSRIIMPYMVGGHCCDLTVSSDSEFGLYRDSQTL